MPTSYHQTTNEAVEEAVGTFVPVPVASFPGSCRQAIHAAMAIMPMRHRGVGSECMRDSDALLARIPSVRGYQRRRLGFALGTSRL